MAGTLLSSRLVGMLRLIVLARLLEPRAFGLGALGFAVALFLEALSETGAEIAILQARERAPRLLDAAWTLRLLRGAGVGLLMAALAPIVGALFGSAELVPIVRLMALIPLLDGAVSIGLFEARRRFDYRPTAIVENGAAVADLVVSVGMALLGAGVWSLVAGWVAASSTRVALSFRFPYRPRFCMDAEPVRELLGFGRWVTASSISNWVLVHGLGVFVARALGLEALGLFQVAWRLAVQPLQELEQVAAVTVSAFAELRSKTEQLSVATVRLFGTVTLPVVTVALILAVHAPELVRLLLGERWNEAAPLVRALAFAGIGRGLLSAATPVMHGLGVPRLRALTAALEITLLALAGAALVVPAGPVGIALAAAGAALAAASWAWRELARLTRLDASSLLAAAAGPVVSCGPLVLFRAWTGTPMSAVMVASSLGASLALFAAVLLLLRRLGLYRWPPVPRLAPLRDETAGH